MGVLPIVVLSTLCLLSPGAAENRADCKYEDKTFKDGDTFTINCFVCECVNGEIKDCLVAVNCPVAADKSPQIQGDINYSDEPDVFGSSDSTVLNRKKRSLFGKPKDSGNNGGAGLSLGGGIMGLQSGKNIVGGNAEVKASVGKETNILGNIPNLIPKEVKVNASFQVGGAGLGIQGGVGVNRGEEKRIQDELRKISEEKKESSGGLAGVGIQAGLSVNGGEEKRIQEELRKISEEKEEKTKVIGGKIEIPNLNVGGVLGQHSGKIEFGNGGETKTFEISGKHDINGGLEITNELNKEGENHIFGLKGGKIELPHLNMGGSLGHHTGKIEFGNSGETKTFEINGKHEINGGLEITSELNKDGGKKVIDLKGGKIELPNLNIGGVLGHHTGKIEFGNGGERKTFEINGKQEINGGFEITNDLSKEGGKQVIGLNGGKIEIPNLNAVGVLGHHTGKIEFGNGGETKTFEINGKHEINGGLKMTNVLNKEGEKQVFGLKGGKIEIPHLNMGGSLGHHTGKIEFGNSGETKTFEIKGKHEINGGLEITSELNKEGGKKVIDLKGDKLELPNLNVGGVLGHHTGKIEFGNGGERKTFEINGKHEINGGFEITSDLKKEGGKQVIGLNGGKIELPNLNVGGILGHHSGKIEFGNGGETKTFEINGKHEINGGLEITNEMNKEGEKRGKIEIPHLNLGGSLGHHTGKIEFGNKWETKTFETNGKHEFNGGLEITSELNQEGGKQLIGLKGGKLELPNINVGGVLGHHTGKIEYANGGERKTFEINGKHEINGGLEITSELNKEGGKHVMDLNGGKMQLPKINVGGGFGRQHGKVEFANGGETHTFQMSGKHEFKGGFGKSSEEHDGEGKHIIDFNGGKIQVPKINVGGSFGHQHGKIEFGNGGETHSFEINGKHEINGGLDVTSQISKEGGKQVIGLKGGKIEIPNLNVGGVLGHQTGKIEFGNGRERKPFAINGKHEINGGLEITSELNKEEGKHVINWNGGKLQLPKVNVGGSFGHQHGKIEFGNSGETQTFEMNGKHEISGGLDVTSEINKEGRKQVIDLKGGKLELPNLNVGGVLGHHTGKIEFGNGGERKTYEINGKHEINGGLEISSELNKEGEKHVIDLNGGKIQLPKINVGGSFGHQHGNIELGNGLETKTFEVNGKHEISGGLEITSQFSKGGGKFGYGVNGKKIFGKSKDDSKEDGSIKFGGKIGNEHGSKEEHGQIGITIKGGSKKSSEEDNSEENKGSVKFGSKIVHEHGSTEEHGKINFKIKGGMKKSSEEDNSEENKGSVKFGGKIAHEHGSKEEHGKIDFKIKGGIKKSSEEDNSEENKGSVKFGGKIAHEHGSKEEHGKIDFKIKGGNKKSSEEDNSEENKGSIKFGGKIGHEHGSKEEHGKIGIKIKGGSKKSSEEDNSEENKGSIKFGGKIDHEHGSKEEHGKIGIKIKEGGKKSSEEDNSEENKGSIKFGGKIGHGHGSKEEHGKIGFKIKGGSKKSSEEDNSEENKGSIKFGAKFGHEHGSKEEHGKVGIKIRGGGKKSSEENKGTIKFGGKFGHGQGSKEEHGNIGFKIKGGNKDSSDEDNSKENKESDEKSSFEDIDLDIGTAPTYSPEFTIEPMIVPQTAQLLSQGHSLGVADKVEKNPEPEDTVNQGSPEESEESSENPIEPETPIKHVEPEPESESEEPVPSLAPEASEESSENPIEPETPIKEEEPEPESEEPVPSLAPDAPEEPSENPTEPETPIKNVEPESESESEEPVPSLAPEASEESLENPTEPETPIKEEEPEPESEKPVPSLAPDAPEEPSENPTEPETPIKNVEPESESESEEPVPSLAPEASEESLENPTEPETPIKHVEPEPESEEPEEPFESPIEPETPIKHVEPEHKEPVPSVAPEAPQEPSENPIEPETPIKHVEPGPEPEQPEEPVKPTKPVQPVTPGNPTVPAEPKQAGKSCTFNKDSVSHGKTVELECVTCACNDGDLTCVKNLNCPGVCSVTGFQMIRTFDGTLYETPGDCNYILVKTPAFTISLNNKLCSELSRDNYDSRAVCIESVEIYIPSKANIKLLHNGTILSQGETTALPYSLLDTITVLRSSSTFLDVASPLFNLQFDLTLNRLYVILDASNKGQTSGLCGTYNDNRNDDYRSSNDITETVSSFFSKSWKTSQCSEYDKGLEDKDKKVNAELTCADALESSIFEDCALLIDIHSYKVSCTSSVYYNEENGLCAALADYSYRCARAGIFVEISSSFSECSPNCEGDASFITEDTFTQQDCAEFSSKLLKITSSIPLNEGCICPPDLYYDSSLQACVSGNTCPCYNNNRVYKLGEIITQANGQTCPCERLLQCGDTEEPPIDVEECSENEVYSDCLIGTGKSCEPSCDNLAIFDKGCTLDCKPGCVCKSGLLRNSAGNCVPLNECPCVHGDEIYNPGETLAQDCNTCTCENGKFSCTKNPCNKVCNAYAGSQFFLFDNVWKTFATKQCPIVLAESRKDESPFFKVVMLNSPNEAMGGALLKKTIYIAFGGASVVLSEFDTTVVLEPGSTTQLRTYRSGFYEVVHFLEGLAVYYDQHLDVIVQLEPKLQGKVQGMCGDADGTTTSELAISNMAQYASQFLVGECPNDDPTLPPPTDNHKKFVEKRCSLLRGDEFSECHTVVNVEPYYMACVEETEACREGESCLCYCTSLAAYARACCRKGITIEWRSPDTCPSPCEYYNREAGEGPYRLVMMNSKTLVADYDKKTVSLETVDAPGILKASFMVTPSLYVDKQNGRKLISLESAQHHNFFIAQNDDGSLSLQKWQQSVEFRKRATFVLRPSRWVQGFNALESYLLRGQYLSIAGEDLIMSKVKSVNMLQMSFQLIEESFGLPSFSICTWKYRACGNPCIPTCQDPLGTKCTLTLKVEGCYPMCAPGMVFDEITHRCVQLEDCITPPTPEPCKNVVCKVDPCADDEYLQEVPSTDPCCPKYVCLPLSTTTSPTTSTTTTTTATTTTTPIPTPEVTTCKNVICEPPERCTKNGATLVEVKWADPCCPRFECQCQLSCDPPPTCRDLSPPLKIEDPEDNCCPKYECPLKLFTTTPPTKDKCYGVTCPPATNCGINEKLVELTSENPCCKKYECVSIIITTPTPCEGITCPDHSCNPEDKVLVKKDTIDPCCPVFECVPPETTTPVPIPTTTPKGCEKVHCNSFECHMKGSRAVILFYHECCPVYDCVCDPCDPAPYCDGEQPIMYIDPEMECCPRYECRNTKPRETTTTVAPTTESTTLTVILTTPSTTTGICENVRCESITCQKGWRLEVVPWQDDCCPHFVCKPELTETSTPATTKVTTSCDEVTCIVADCREDEIRLVKSNSADPCCPLYECVPKSTSSPTTIVTTPNDECKDHPCPVITCNKEGSVKKFVGGNDKCCPASECVCEPCSPAPDCGGYKAIVEYNTDKECCPRYTCTTPTPQEKETTPAITTPPPTTDVCKNVFCESVTCTKKGATIKKTYWVDPCCPHLECVCTCDPLPVCEDGSPPITTQDPETHCCPEYECRTPTTPPVITPTKGVCEGVTCESQTCKAGYTLVEFHKDGECCNSFECIPPATTPPTITGCDESRCAIASCKEDEEVIVRANPNDKCCPIYDCILKTTPAPASTPSTTTAFECRDVECKVETCTRKGESQVFVGWANLCCRDYKCECQPCNPPPYCNGQIPVAIFNPDTECCPTYECPPPTPSTTPETILTPTQNIVTTTTTIISSTKITCEDRVCPRKVCKEHERLVKQINPKDPCCPLETCECTCKTIPSCASDERLVAIKQNNQCCPKLKCEKKRDECHTVYSQVTITSGQCSANVIISSCSGYCHSKTSYDNLINPVSQCRCCSVTETRPKTFELPCPDGTKIDWTVREAVECGCNKCSEYEGSASGSGSGSGSGDESSGFTLWSPFELRN